MKIYTIFQFLSAGNSWKGYGSSKRRYFGSGNPSACTCGKQKRCGGHDGRKKMSDRLCNCDANDGDARVDAGILTVKGHLPFEKLNYPAGSSPNASVSLKTGALYCSNSKFGAYLFNIFWNVWTLYCPL